MVPVEAIVNFRGPAIIDDAGTTVGICRSRGGEMGRAIARRAVGSSRKWVIASTLDRLPRSRWIPLAAARLATAERTPKNHRFRIRHARTRAPSDGYLTTG
jgi:hypothetical protein